MGMIRWPLPYDHEQNRHEIVGRYIAQVLFMERFINMSLLDLGASPRKLKRAKLNRKIEDMRSFIARPELALNEWDDLPDLMERVARHRNDFAHRMFERNAIPPHHEPVRSPGYVHEELSEEELRDQEWEAFEASEICRQLSERLHLAPLNPGKHFGRTTPLRPPDWPLSTPWSATR